MGQFYDYDFEMTSKGIVRRYSAGGIPDIEEVDSKFQEVVYDCRQTIFSYSSKLLLIMRSLYSAGKIPGYQFLMEMPEFDAEEWLEKAMRKCRRLYKDNPEQFPRGGIIDSFDRLRAYRKAQSAAKKKKKAESVEEAVN